MAWEATLAMLESILGKMEELDEALDRILEDES